MAIFCIALTSCSAKDSSIRKNTLQNSAIIKSATLTDLKQLPIADPPIVSAKEAISYAIHVESVQFSLEEVTSKTQFVVWDVTSQLKTDDGSSQWEVKIKSSGMLPSFTCKVLFTREGKIISDHLINNFCTYNK